MQALEPIYSDVNTEKCDALRRQERDDCDWCGAKLSIYHQLGESLCWPCQHKQTMLPKASEQPLAFGRSSNSWAIRYAMICDEMRGAGTFTGQVLVSRLGWERHHIARALLLAVTDGLIEYDGSATQGFRTRYRWIGK